jgi:carbonic anhydrase
VLLFLLSPLHRTVDGSGDIAVLAVLFDMSLDGSTTQLLSGAFQNLGRIVNPGTVTTTGPLVFNQLVNHLQTTPLFQYTGSLTTPPCAEGLTFLVTAVPMPINVPTYRALKSVVKFNSRFTQNTLGEQNLLLVAGADQRVNQAICGGERS